MQGPSCIILHIFLILQIFCLFVCLLVQFHIKTENTCGKISVSLPWDPETLHSLASDRKVWVYRWLCTPTPQCHRWSSERLGASRSAAVKLWSCKSLTVNEHLNATQMPECYLKAALLQ